jgi:NIPSNAP
MATACCGSLQLRFPLLVHVSYGLGLFPGLSILALGIWAWRDPLLATILGVVVFIGASGFDTPLLFGFGLAVMPSGHFMWLVQAFIVVLLVDGHRVPLHKGGKMKTFVTAGIAIVGILALQGLTGKADNPANGRVFELRTYYPAPGKIKALHDRFRNHTNKLFEKHGMTIIGFWVPLDAKEAEHKLVYLLAFPSKEAADKSWAAFRQDPEWNNARAASEVNGKLVERVESVFMRATDYSPLK